MIPGSKEMFGKNIYEKRVWALVSILVFVLVTGGAAFAIQSFGNGHSGNLVSTVGINSDVGQVWGFNGSAKNPTYQAATLTTGSGYVSASFKAGFNVTHIVVFQKNDLYNVQGILNSSLYFSTLNVGLAVQNATAVVEPETFNLTSVTQAFGTQVNDTSLNHQSDKAIINANPYTVLNTYSNSVNQLNKTVAFSLFGLFASNYNDRMGIIINVNSTGIPAANHLIVKITQSFGAPFNINLITSMAVALTVIMGLSLVTIFLGLPRLKGGR